MITKPKKMMLMKGQNREDNITVLGFLDERCRGVTLDDSGERAVPEVMLFDVVKGLLFEMIEQQERIEQLEKQVDTLNQRHFII